MHHLDVLNSEKIILEITRNKSFKNLPDHYKYRISIYKVYWQLMKDELLSKENKRLKIAKLLNDLQGDISDRNGFVFAIKIIELIESLRSEDYDMFYEKSILIKRYSKQYLSKDNTQRESWLIELLSKIHQNKNNKQIIAKENAEFLLKLKSNNDLLLVNDYEILPYHFLWEIILKYL